jgi:hypothetical protein
MNSLNNNDQLGTFRNPKRWGPSAWRLMEAVAIDRVATPGDKKQFYKLIGDVLPCAKCRKSYRQFIKELPVNIDSPKATLYWLYQIHNRVNDKLRKQDPKSQSSENSMRNPESVGPDSFGIDLTQAPNPAFEEVYQRVTTSSSSPDDLWSFLQTIAMNYDPTIHKKSTYRAFFNNLKRTIPYHEYNEPYSILLQRFPIDSALKSNTRFQNYVKTIVQALSDSFSN